MSEEEDQGRAMIDQVQTRRSRKRIMIRGRRRRRRKRRRTSTRKAVGQGGGKTKEEGEEEEKKSVMNANIKISSPAFFLSLLSNSRNLAYDNKVGICSGFIRNAILCSCMQRRRSRRRRR